MRGAPGRQAAVERDWPGHRRPFESPAGLRLLVPGWPQFSWGQAQRGWVLLGSFVVAAGAAVLAWGTWLSWGFFAFGFLVHVSSTTDAIRQALVPGLRPTDGRADDRRVAGVPPLPAGAPDPDRHRLAGPAPRTGRRASIWSTAGPTAAPRRGAGTGSGSACRPQGRLHAARVVAAAGQEVEWTGREWRVDGQGPGLLAPLRTSAWPQACRFKVPPDQVLVEPEEDGGVPAIDRLARPGAPGPDHRPRLGPVLSRLGPPPCC